VVTCSSFVLSEGTSDGAADITSVYKFSAEFEKFVDWWQCAAVMQRKA
jgi:hypothetical protein